jgi:hypothetical protein
MFSGQGADACKLCYDDVTVNSLKGFLHDESLRTVLSTSETRLSESRCSKDVVMMFRLRDHDKFISRHLPQFHASLATANSWIMPRDQPGSAIGQLVDCQWLEQLEVALIAETRRQSSWF